MTTHKNCYYHDTTQFFVLVKGDIFDKVAPLYEQGLSLRDIQTQTGISKTTIRKVLLKAGISLRENRPTSLLKEWKAKGKQSSLPPYGFAYLQGKVVPNPKEFKILLLIQRLWQKGMNANAIATKLNSQRIPSRMGKEWSWNAVKNILDRLRKKQIDLSGANHGL